jgi:CRP/FNR family transcriptional regulator, cyclic AMP receptor protein
VKRPTTILLARFTGRSSKQNILDALKAQGLVAGNPELAHALYKKGVLRTFPRQAVLIEQDDGDNDIFLILSGSVSIKYNKREIAIRSAKTHVGELALVEKLVKRSATVTAIEPTAALQVSECAFSIIANKYPDLWRRVAIEIGNRLRERNKYIRTPNNRPALFIGSSSEGYSIADQIYRKLAAAPIVPRVWTEGVFQPSQTSIESLVKAQEECDFAALVLTADDVTVSRSRKKHSPRDNVVFELGLFMGALGRERVFILKPLGLNIKIPSDLLGVTCIEYASRGKHSVQKVSLKLRKTILKLGSR